MRWWCHVHALLVPLGGGQFTKEQPWPLALLFCPCVHSLGTSCRRELLKPKRTRAGEAPWFFDHLPCDSGRAGPRRQSDKVLLGESGVLPFKGALQLWLRPSHEMMKIHTPDCSGPVLLVPSCSPLKHDKICNLLFSVILKCDNLESNIFFVFIRNFGPKVKLFSPF